MKKDFFTDRLGMYGDPDGNFVIPGDLSSTPITTKYLQRPIIATAADGTTKILPPGMDNIKMPSNTVLEMKYQMGGAQANAQAQQQQLMQLISMYCQKVGGGDQSCAQKVAQSLQKNPEQMIQQMMAAVQEGQPQGQMEEEEEDEMARDGGCIDCQEQFPQAQNLNWFYKAEGGEAFPQANTYPTNWADYSGNQYAIGGEAFPQAQTYLPYDRPGETRLNGMFQTGGTLYDYVKSIGLDPSFKSRKELFKNMFDEEYTGNAEQNIYLLNALKSGNIKLEGSKTKPAASKVDNRKLPQTGVVVDKRSGEAILLGNKKGYQFPVLTGRDVESNYVPNYLGAPGSENFKNTPMGYYVMGAKDPKGKTLNASHFEGGVGSWLNPIGAFGMDAPIAVGIGMHGTYDKANRDRLYTAMPTERNVSSGCINCKKEDYENIMKDIGVNDTVLVLDTKNKSDMNLFQKAQKTANTIADKERRANMYTVAATDAPGVTGRGYEYGGQALDQIYQMMKKGGLNYDPKKKKGKQETFEQYQMRMGGLPKAQVGMQNMQDLNAWQRFRLNTKDFFTSGDGASINIKDRSQQGPPSPNATWMNSPDSVAQGRYDQLGVQKGFVPEGRYDMLNASQQQSQQSSQDQRSAFGPEGKGQGTAGGKGQGTQNPYGDNLYNAYQTGQNFTNIFGNKAGAWSSIIGGGLSAMAGFGSGLGKSKFRFKEYDAEGNRVAKGRLKGQAADIAAGNLFNRQTMSNPNNIKTGSSEGKYPNTFPYMHEPGETWQTGGSASFKYTTYTGPNEQSMMPSAWSAGVADAFELNRREEELEKMGMRSTGMSMVPATTAQKTQAGSPQGAINAPSFVPKTTVANFGQDTYMQNPMMNYAQYGGMMMDDLYEDGGEYSLDDMTPEDRDDFLRKLHAAGYDVEFID